MRRVICMIVASALYVHFGASTALAGSSAGLVATLAAQSGLSEEQAAEQVSEVFNALSVELKEGRAVTVRNFGKFYLSTRKARMARNPKTGEAVKVPDRSYPRFSSSDNLKKSVAEVSLLGGNKS